MSRKEVNTKDIRSKSPHSSSRGVGKKHSIQQHVVPLGNGWVVKSSGSKKFTAITDTKKEAVAIATLIAKSKGSVLIIHGKDGAIAEQTNYAKAK